MNNLIYSKPAMTSNNQMEKILEAENEDERHNTLFDKITEELRDKEEYKIDEKSIDELIGKENNIQKGNIKEYFNPCLYNNTDESQNRRMNKYLKTENTSVNKSDLSPHHSNDPIEVN